MQTSKLIVRPQKVKELVAHDMKAMEEKLGPLYIFMNNKMVKDANVSVFVHYIKNVPEPPPDYVDIHKHDVGQIYVFPDKGLAFEVTLGNDKYAVESPAAVFIPPNLKHTLKLLKGSGIEVCIFTKPTYEVT
jgi:lipopolysaccharide biosynthesis protein